MPNPTLATLLLLTCGLVMGGCATGRQQGFNLLNEGTAEVRDVEIRYGDYVFPSGGASAIVRVSKFRNVGFHQGATVAIPSSAKIHWTSADGQSHDVTAPIEPLIADAATFDGFDFIFVDDHVDLAVVYRDKAGGAYGLHRVRAYSSATGGAAGAQ